MHKPQDLAWPVIASYSVALFKVGHNSRATQGIATHSPRPMQGGKGDPRR